LNGWLQVFEAALAQGLVWKHDADWAVFNSGMGRGGDASQPQLVFLQRRDWQLKTGSVVVKPWVASSKVRSEQQHRPSSG
jgi:hypothetical protein